MQETFGQFCVSTLFALPAFLRDQLETGQFWIGLGLYLLAWCSPGMTKRGRRWLKNKAPRWLIAIPISLFLFWAVLATSFQRYNKLAQNADALIARLEKPAIEIDAESKALIEDVGDGKNTAISIDFNVRNSGGIETVVEFHTPGKLADVYRFFPQTFSFGKNGRQIVKLATFAPNAPKETPTIRLDPLLIPFNYYSYYSEKCIVFQRHIRLLVHGDRVWTKSVSPPIIKPGAVCIRQID